MKIRVRKRFYWLFLVIIVGLVVLGLSLLPADPRITVNPKPTGFKRDQLMEVADEVASTHQNIHSLIIERQGAIALI